MTVDEDADLLLGDQQYHDGDIVKVLCIVTGKKTKILKRRGTWRLLISKIPAVQWRCWYFRRLMTSTDI